MRFCDVLEIKNGRNQKQVENPDGIYPIYGSGGIMGWADSYICDAHTVIIGRKGTINNPIYVDRPFWNVDTAFGLVANRDMLLPKYLFYFCCNFDFEKLNTTVTIPSLTKSNLLNIEISVPPIAIQQEIINRLDKIENLIELRRNQLEQLNQLVKSRFIELFGDNVHTVKLGDVCRMINGDRGKNYPSGDDFVEEGVPFVNAGHLQNRKVDFCDMNYITEEKFDLLSQGKMQRGDILYCLRGSLGKHGLVDFERGAVASSLVILRCNQKQILPKFLLYALETPEIELQLKAANNGSSQPNLSAASVKAYDVKLPAVEQQIQFVAFVEQTDKLKFIVQNNITAYTALIFYFANIYWKRWASVSNTGVSL